MEAYDTLDAGEQRLYRDTLDASLQSLDESAEAAQRATRLDRGRDEIMVREMARHRHDSKEFLSAAQEAHRRLEELMRRDINGGKYPV